MGKTKIDWCDRVWNPTTGCTKVSQGCKFCYAERISERFWGKAKFTDVRCHPLKLEDPLHWRMPQRVFVDSMSDLFHPDIPDEFIDSIFSIIAQADQHIFMILTKRAKRMYEWSQRAERKYLPKSEVWLGVSVEDQATADERIPLLLQTPAAVRFVSYEPALGPLDFQLATWFHNPFPEKHNLPPNGIGLDWVIQGCESGPSARPMKIEWAQSAKDQCHAAGVPFFFKQAVINGKLTHMPELDGRQWAEFPEVR
jgi:protein gp37